VKIILWGKESRNALEVLKKIKEEIDINLVLLPILNRYRYFKELVSSDIVVGQFGLGALGMTEYEALFFNKAVVTGKLLNIVKIFEENPPVYELDLNNDKDFSETIYNILINKDLSLSTKGYSWVFKKHYLNSMKGILTLYRNVLQS